MRVRRYAEAADDWRFLHVISLTSQLTQLLSLKVSNTVRYLHLPAPGFRGADSTTSIALVAKFTRPKNSPTSRLVVQAIRRVSFRRSSS